MLGTAAAALFGYQLQGQPSGYWPLAAVSTGLSALWYVTLRQTLSETARICGALAAQLVTAWVIIGTLGVCAEALLTLVGFVTLTALHFGARQAQGAFALALITILAAPWLAAHAEGLEGLRTFDHHLNWIRAGLLGSCVIVLVGGYAAILLRELTSAVDAQRKLVHELDREVEERKNAMARLAETQERLVHAHKLEAVGRLAGGVAHDFNNTLTIILSYGELLRSRLSREPKLAELADHIVQAAQQGGDLTQQLLTFTRRQVIKPRTISVQRVLGNIERALSRLVPETIHVHRVETDEDLYVNIDPTQLHQAVLNLALNARDAMTAGGDLFLEASTAEVDAEGLPLLPGRYVTIRVRDTGTGMAPETQAQIFEPFFTTKEPGLGTGLGLANVLESVQSASGHVTVSSELGRGSELTIYLPLVEPRPSGIEPTRPAEHAAPQGRLLVVDDEAQVREVIRRMLADQGFEVRTADSAQAALEILRSEPVALLCTDMVMPEGSGIRLIHEARTHQPWLPIVICSAYGIDGELSKRILSGDLAFVAKPFSREQLRDAVSKALAAAKERRVSRVSEAS